jgi:cytochrome P450
MSAAAAFRIAKMVLRDPERHYGELSGFFQTRGGNLGPRSVQSAIGQHTRLLLRPYVADRVRMRTALAPLGVAATVWPDAGPLLAHQFFQRVLLSGSCPPRLHELLRRVITEGMAMLNGSLPTRMRRSFLRQRTLRLLEEEIARRRLVARPDPADVLDVMILVAPEASAETIAEVYLFLFRSVTGAVGFTIGWALWLAGRWERIADLPSGWVVNESLRLFPAAWMFGRMAAREHALGAHRVRVGDQVRICAYLVHRDPQYWDEPDTFRPQRWAAGSHDAFMPFGGGPFTCAGASVSQAFAEVALDVFTHDLRFSVVRSGERPQVSSVLMPPRFEVRLERRPDQKGGER